MKILVIGGVAGGASAAARARRLDERAEIVVIERSDYVSFANCGLPYHIGGIIADRERLLLQTPESLKESLNLDVRTGHEARSIDRAGRRVRIRNIREGREYDETYDALILCPGAVPLRPDIPGLDHPRVHVLRNVEDMDRIKAAVDAGVTIAVVIGGGYIGVEMAENLRHRGAQVELVEMFDQVMPVLDREMTAPVEDHLRLHGVSLRLGAAAAAIRDASGRAAVELKDGTTLTADLVILSVGVRPETALAREAGLELGPRGGIRVDAHMRTSDPAIYAAGDAVETGHTVLPGSWLIPLAGPANRQARVAAENACGRDTRYESTQGTAVCKVFDMTLGGTGATERNLLRAGMPYRKVYVHPSGHAGYYPGTAPMHLKLLFSPDTGRLLGAQAAGFDGVDKRLDVLATALRAGLTVHDLERLELSYAPPYGAAKDPVNMAGFVAANVLRGDVAFWYAEEFRDGMAGATVLDVRGKAEFDEWHIPGAVNIRLGELRARLGDIPRDRPVRVYCKVGFRSYLAYRILKQEGFDVATLAGGTTTFRAWHRTAAGASEAEDAPLLSYAEEKMAAPAPASGRVVRVDCAGLQCPGPILRIGQEMAGLAVGDEMLVRVTDAGFPADAAAWCRRHGHQLVDVRPDGVEIEARIRKGAAPESSSSPGAEKNRKTFVVFSGDLDRVMAAFIIANGALAMGNEVTMFFTFWGLNALRRADAPDLEKSAMDRMFGAMMPRGPDRMKLSKMNMFGAGTAMMKKVMRDKGVSSLPKLVEMARTGGARLVACTMTMDVMGLRREELVDGIEFGGVAAFLGAADESSTTLFI